METTLAKANSRYSRVRCLLVEDSEFDQRRIQRVLEQHGVKRLDIARDVATARDYLTTFRPDLILMDNRLPDGSGVDLALELRQDPATEAIPVVIISDWPTPFMFDKALIARVRSVLNKDEFNLASAVEILNHSRGLAAAPRR